MGAHPVHRLPQQARHHRPATETAAVLVGRLEGHPGQQEAVTVWARDGRLTAPEAPQGAPVSTWRRPGVEGVAPPPQQSQEV